MTWHLTPAERLANAKKAAQTRLAHGIKPFGGKHGTHKGNSKNFAHMTPEQRIARAKKAAATRKSRSH